MSERRVQRQTAEIEARGADGRVHRVIEYTNYLETTHMDGSLRTTATSKLFRLHSGGSLNPQPDGRFVIVATGELLTRSRM
jgi:hypothetical protein